MHREMTDPPAPAALPLSSPPDPSAITAAALKELKNDLRYESAKDIDSANRQLSIRIDAIDKASDVLAEKVNRVPTLLDREITGLRTAIDLRLEAIKELSGVGFEGIQVQLKERDERTKAADDSSKLAIKDALQAQKESAAATQENNKAAIDKSEAGFKDQIKALDTQLNSAKETLGTLLTDAKDRISRLEAAAITKRDVTVEGHQAISTNVGIITLAVGITALGASILFGTLISLHSPPAPAPAFTYPLPPVASQR